MTEELFKKLKGWETKAEGLEAEAQKEIEQTLRDARARSRELLQKVKAEASAQRERLLEEAEAEANLEARGIEEEGRKERERLKERWAERKENALRLVLERMESYSGDS